MAIEAKADFLRQLEALRRLEKTELVYLSDRRFEPFEERLGYPISDDDYAALKPLFDSVRTVEYNYGDDRIGIQSFPAVSHVIAQYPGQKYLIPRGDYWSRFKELAKCIEVQIGE